MAVTNLYTEEQVKTLLKDQRKLCFTRMELSKFDLYNGIILAPEPDFPEPYLSSDDDLCSCGDDCDCKK